MAGNYTMSNVFAGEDTAVHVKESFTLLALFNFFQIFGFLSLAVVVLTAWMSPRVHRTPAWYLFMASWMFFCLSYFIIVGQQVGVEPPFGVCVTQAALIYAAPPLTSCVSLSFLLQLYSTVSSVLRNGKVTRTRSILLHSFPFAVHFVVFLETLIIGLLNPPQVSRDVSGMYCHLTNSFQVKVSAVVVILAMITMLVYEALTTILLYRNWTAFQRLRVRSNNAVSLPLMTRVTIFSFLPMVAMVISSLSFLPSSPIREAKTNLVIASLPAAAAVIFGTQRDILNVWMFWRKVRPVQMEKPGIPPSKPEDSPV